MSEPNRRNSGNTKIGVRPETLEKYKAIAAQQRRSLVETADVLADDYMTREGINLPKASDESKRPRRRKIAA